MEIYTSGSIFRELKLITLDIIACLSYLINLTGNVGEDFGGAYSVSWFPSVSFSRSIFIFSQSIY